MSLSVVILAAGKGTRMLSRLPKVLHPIAGRPMLQHVLHTARQLEPTALTVVVGAGDDVRSALDSDAQGARPQIVVQAEQRGTGHAVAQARDAVAGRAATVLVLYGDTPLLTATTLRRLAETHLRTGATITLLTTRIADPTLRPNGRVVRDTDGAIVGIVEAPEATPAQREIDECNMGIYAFRDDWLWPALADIRPSAVKGEIYLTALIGQAIEAGQRVSSVETADTSETLGVDTRALLAEAEAVLRKRLARFWQGRGVTIVDPNTTYIDVDVNIGPDTTLFPSTHLQGQTSIGAGCRIGPNAIVRSARLGDGSQVEMAVVEGVEVAAQAVVGPFMHLTPTSTAS
ncbi:MAG: bifunctional N-acetylglucosamine-1-phosphate uridyltransferase/glucosamine-1-phosphate acetyltransferase [Anaerolineae bacterium]|nr:bifunctional N-acetylglucosamine-1-phosphate uridyltransferase/glucosamine-1-phosphate acetyltransferase [Anaerolineae bacterium]